MITTTDSKKEFAQLLKEHNAIDELDFLRSVAKEFFNGPLPDDTTVLYLRRRDDE